MRNSIFASVDKSAENLPKISMEFFPAKNDEAQAALSETLARLCKLTPDFVSVTYGAGGSTREPTLRTVDDILTNYGVPTMAHLTVADASRAQTDAAIDAFQELGVRRFLALRGDPAGGVGTVYQPHPDGYENAAELVSVLAKRGGLDICVAAYPEKHPESVNWEADIEMLKRKVDNGASSAVTQFFFDNADYWRYLEKVRAAGIDIPVVPGILPIHKFSAVSSFAAKCHAKLPDWLSSRFAGLDDDPKTHALVAAAIAAEQVLALMEEGVSDIHFYTMNRADLTYAVCHLIGLHPQSNGRIAA